MILTGGLQCLNFSGFFLLIATHLYDYFLPQILFADQKHHLIVNIDWLSEQWTT